MKKFGSGMFIPDPQHWTRGYEILSISNADLFRIDEKLLLLDRLLSLQLRLLQELRLRLYRNVQNNVVNNSKVVTSKYIN